MGVKAKETPRVCHRECKKTPASLGYPPSVFNKNSTLKRERTKKKTREKAEKKRKKRGKVGGRAMGNEERKREGDGFRRLEERGY